MYNKTIIGFGFCDMQNYQCLGKSYQPRLRLDPNLPVGHGGVVNSPVSVFFYLFNVESWATAHG